MTAPALDRDDIPRGLLLMVAAVLLSPLIDIFGKLAIATMPSGEIATARFILQALFLLPVVIMRGSLLDLTWKKTALHAVRGGLLVIMMLSFITPLKVMEVADAIAIFFVEPIILTILGSIFLKETIGWRRYTACGVGFGGALLVIQPSMQEVGPIALLPLVAAATLAVFLLITRLMSQNEDPWSMQFYAGLWGAAFCCALLWLGNGTGSDLFDPVMPGRVDSLYLLAIGVVATVSGVLGVYAYRAAPASVLAPLQYLEIVSATVFGWLVFDHVPALSKWTGIVIIVGSGCYIILRERKLSKTAGVPPVSPAI